MRYPTIPRFLLIACSCAFAQVSDKQCASLDKRSPEPDTLLPVVHLDQAQDDRIKRERACLKSYSYPGGEEALVNASSAQVRDDLKHLTTLFDSYSKLNIKTLPENDQLRVIRIEMGWQREQVLLWGNMFYIRKLYTEEKYATILKEVERIRNEFGLDVAPLKKWDDADDATYYSVQTLRNMIATFEFAAKGHLLSNSGPERQQLVASYLKDEPALVPTFAFSVNPGKAVLGPVCRGEN